MSMRFNPAYLFDTERDIVSKKYGSAANSGTIFMEQTAGTPDPDYVEKSDTIAAYLLYADITSDGPTDFELITGQFRFEFKVDTLAPFFLIKKNAIITKLTNYKSTSTGALTSSTSIGTELGVIDGQLCEKQDTGDGSTLVGYLIKNEITDNSSIDVRFA